MPPTTANQRWRVLSILVSGDRSDDVSSALAEFSPNGIEEVMKQDGGCEFRAFFSDDSPVEKYKESMRSAFPSAQLNMSDCMWDPHDESWRQHFAPYEIAPGIIITPSWEHYQAKADEQIITLDPGMAFGTGLHPTTRMCADALNGISQRGSLIDIGCGSGILMLVAKLSGYEDIVGVEIDEDAAHVARENCELNGLPGAQVWSESSEVKGQYDVVVANILLITLLTICDDIARISKPGATLLLSGITVDQVDEILETYGKHFQLIEKKEMDEWRCLVMKRNS